MKTDKIHIQGLKTPVQIGVPDDERARWQTLEIDLTIIPNDGFADLKDEIERTIDYERVSLEIRDVASTKPRKLLETLGEDLAAHVLEEFPVTEVSLTLRKFILPGTDWVGVSLTRSRGD